MYTIINTDTNERIKVRAASALEALDLAAEETGWERMEAFR